MYEHACTHSFALIYTGGKGIQVATCHDLLTVNDLERECDNCAPPPPLALDHAYSTAQQS